MPGEENKAQVRRFIEEVLNKKSVDAIDEFFAPDYVEHDEMPGVEPGIEGLKQVLSMYFAAFPDLHVHVEDLIAEGDKVVGRMFTHGTHQGEFMGIAATGKQVKFAEIHIARMSGGKMVEHWGIIDNMAMMQQLGVIPSEKQS